MLDCVCIFAAIFFFTGNLLEIVATILRGQHHNTNYESLRALDPEYLMDQWLGGDTTTNRLFLWSGIIKTLAWFTFMIPIMQLAWILSRGGKRKLGAHVGMSVLVLSGGMTELICRLMIIGSYNAAHWIANDFNLGNWIGGTNDDDIGWRVLEIVYIVVEGAILWIDAFEWLAIFGIMCALYYSVVTLPDNTRVVGLWLARLGLLIGILSLFDFAADVLRFESWTTFSKFAILISILNTLILLPVWLVMLAIQLPMAQPKYSEQGEEEEAFVGNGGARNLHGSADLIT